MKEMGRERESCKECEGEGASVMKEMGRERVLLGV